MGDLLSRALQGVDPGSPLAAWQIFRNLVALIPWWQMLVWNLAFIAVGALLGRWRGRIGEGVAWAALLGPLGWLVVLARPRRSKPR